MIAETITPERAWLPEVLFVARDYPDWTVFMFEDGKIIGLDKNSLEFYDKPGQAFPFTTLSGRQPDKHIDEYLKLLMDWAMKPESHG